MKHQFNPFFFIILIPLLLSMTSAQENNVRPVRDNVGFCWRASEMDTLMNYLSEHSETKTLDDGLLIGGISPHDDYLYAGRVYYPLYRLIRTKEVVIFGVTHGTVRKAMNDPKNVLILDDYKYWKGPYKNVEMSPLREFIKSRLNNNYYMVSDKAQDIEHSIEALVPFLQYFNRNVKITPIMVTQMSFDRMDSISTDLSGIIKEYITSNNLKPGKDIFFLISTDADHYGEDFDNSPFGEDEKAHAEATANDRRIANTYINADITYKDIEGLKNELWGSPDIKTPVPLWCGKYSVPFGMLSIYHIAKDLNLKNLHGKLSGYSDSWTEKTLPVYGTHMGTTAPFSLKHWCGYVAAGIYVNK
jgi:AmmeMemoRadiSam system protein B